MDDLDHQVLGAARRWADEGFPILLVTVARTWGSAPRPPGAWMVVRNDGRVVGSVSGGCIEEDLIQRIVAGDFIGETQPRVVRYGVTADEAHRFGLPCGGTLELMLEPAPDLGALANLAARIDNGQLALRAVSRVTGAVTVSPACASDVVHWDGDTLTTVHGPGLRLLIIGAGQISHYLATMAMTLGYRVFVCDPRSEYADTWTAPGVTLLSCMPDDAVTELALDPRSAVVALTHDPKLDDMALLEALKSSAFYVGALGSRANNDKRRARLRQYFDLSTEEIDRLHGPVGLPIGSRTPPEIAVSILAEMTAVKNGQAVRQRTGEVDAYACGGSMTL